MNCCIVGHDRHHCNKPIYSIGVILVTPYDDPPKVLMVQRKQSIGFIEYVKGHYDSYSLDTVWLLIHDMTKDERDKIVSMSFDDLWLSVWSGDTSGRRSHRMYIESEQKYLRTIDIIRRRQADVIYRRSGLEWGFPKGHRMDASECDICCAVRELEEETNVVSSDFIVVAEPPYEEHIVGMNSKKYIYVYYLCYAKRGDIGYISETNRWQQGEIGNLRWMTLEDALSVTDSDNVARVAMLTDIFGSLAVESKQEGKQERESDSQTVSLRI